MQSTLLAVSCAAALAVVSVQLEARVTGITILSTTPAFGGQTFGSVGAYEQVRGVATGELDPFSRHNSVITDIALAPRNPDGKVTYAATFTLLKPVDMSKASGVLVYGISNRGGRALGFGNLGGSATNAGDGFDQKPGHTYLASGWQGDLPFNNGAATTFTWSPALIMFERHPSRCIMLMLVVSMLKCLVEPSF